MAGIPINEVRIKENADLTALNTLGVKATADTLVEIEFKEHLIALHKSGYFESATPYILGGGSNVLLLDNLSKPVLKVSIPGIEVKKEEGNHIFIEIGAGVNWHNLVEYCVTNNYGGIENLALIPGTTGAAPIQNIGAYGVELDQVFDSLELFDIKSGKLKTYLKEECEFGYRDSIFKRDLKGKVIVTGVTLRLTKSHHLINTGYKALSEFLREKSINSPDLKDIFDAVVAIRKSKLPDPSLLGNAGSFFKNPIVENSVANKLKTNYSDMPAYMVDDSHQKIPAGWLIEKAGWKGKKIGNVGTYRNQALVIVNHGDATGREIYDHAMRIRESVSEKFGISLMPEVNIFGNQV